MSYKLTKKTSPNHSSRESYGHKGSPTGITIHHWGSTGQKHDNVVDYLCRKGGNTSAHEVISGGKVTQLVNHWRAAWHAGSREGNGSTIGLECRPEMSKSDWNTLVERCADIEEIHGSMKYYLHSNWKATACPGKYGPKLGDLIKAINDEHKRRKAKPAKPNTYVVKRGDSLSGIAEKHGTTWKKLQQLNNIRNANLIKVGDVIKLK